MHESVVQFEVNPVNGKNPDGTKCNTTVILPPISNLIKDQAGCWYEGFIFKKKGLYRIPRLL
jgi:hypothetical protein